MCVHDKSSTLSKIVIALIFYPMTAIIVNVVVHGVAY
jgi:hypothetical protein